MGDVEDIIIGASDQALFDGLTRRGVAGTRRLSDGSLRVMLKLHVQEPATRQRPSRRAHRPSEAIHPDALL